MPPQPTPSSQPALALRSAAQCTIEQLTHAFNRGFEGYAIPITQTPDTLQRMIDDNDVRLEQSLVAAAPDGELVGVGLLALRGNAADRAADATIDATTDDAVETEAEAGLRAWIGGMGIAPAWRGKGQGAGLLRALIAQASGRHATHIQLEVLADNVPAHLLYARFGFHETRTLTVYTGVAHMPKRRRQPAPAATFRQLVVAEALALFDAYHPAQPSWQREQATLRHMAQRLEAIGMEDESGGSETSGLRAYALISRQPTGYAILDLGSRAASAVDRKADALGLLDELLRRFPGALLRAINVVPGEPLGDALQAAHCTVVTTQREMQLPLL
ncbi:MAG: GNAT family N-acetyltransferase [Ktedonobacterales bacterium]